MTTKKTRQKTRRGGDDSAPLAPVIPLIDMKEVRNGPACHDEEWGICNGEPGICLDATDRVFALQRTGGLVSKGQAKAVNDWLRNEGMVGAVDAWGWSSGDRGLAAAVWRFRAQHAALAERFAARFRPRLAPLIRVPA